jgi:hypothetical protein
MIQISAGSRESIMALRVKAEKRITDLYFCATAYDALGKEVPGLGGCGGALKREDEKAETATLSLILPAGKSMAVIKGQLTGLRLDGRRADGGVFVDLQKQKPITFEAKLKKHEGPPR